MCNECLTGEPHLSKGYDNQKSVSSPIQAGAGESHIVYQLKQRREYILQQLVDIQNAIAACIIIR